jgi:hypothetical protein
MQTNRPSKIKFRPISHSWVAIHPQPKGVIQFIGGAFFGTFSPTFFYRNLLKYLFLEGYTIIVLPFAFTFNHYKEAAFLIREQYEILPELVRIAKLESYDYNTYLDDSNFSWLGHSLGCKYITLLEGFTALPHDQSNLDFIKKLTAQSYNQQQVKTITRDLNILIEELTKKVIQVQKQIEAYIPSETKKVRINNIFIKDQASVFLAPDISSTSSAIKPQILADFIDSIGCGVKPSPEETKKLIKESNLFHLLSLVEFSSDKIAKETCQWFINYFQKRDRAFQYSLLTGGHLFPLGIPIGKYVFNIAKPIIENLDERNSHFEAIVTKLLRQ